MTSLLKGYVVRYPDCIMAEVEAAIDLLRNKVDLKIADLPHLTIETPDFLLIPGGSCDHAMFIQDFML